MGVLNKKKRVLVVSTSRKTTGGISSVLKLYEQSDMWRNYHCKWIGTHRDGNTIRKLWYLFKSFMQYVILLPFADIVHIHFSTTSSAKRKYPFFKLAKALDKRVVIHLHCGSQIDDIWSGIYQTMFEECDFGVVLSESLKQKVEERIGKSNKLIVIYNPCPIISSENYYLKSNSILFSGHLNEGKGYKDLIKAFANIAHSHPDWLLVFAGNGEIEIAQKLSNKLGIENQVKFLGWVSGETKHKTYREAQFLCLPSYAEGFPMTVLDAWAYGLPVLSTPVGGIPDIAIDGVNMLLFTPGDVKALTEKLEVLISDETLRKKLATESKLLAEGKFSLKTVTEQVASLYNTLLSK